MVNDITQINPISMDRIVKPKSIQDIQEAIRNSKGQISIGGGRYSMGGQTAIESGIQIDMREMNKILLLDIKNKRITVESGIRWRDIQETIDPHNLSVKIMQTYSNFTVGGSLSVNAHGRYVGEGPIIRSVESIKIVLANGSVVEADSKNNSEIFFSSIGGYGGIGVIAEVTLNLVMNEKIENRFDEMSLNDYRKYFNANIKNNPDYIFHNGDLYPPEFSKVMAVSWKKSTKPLSIQDRLQPRDKKYFLQPLAVGVIAVLPGGKRAREKYLDPYRAKKQSVVWRNYEASYDVAELEPLHRKISTYVLQEYFIPVSQLESFVPKMKKVFNDHKVNVVNVSIRHSLPDSGSVMAWAREEVFSLVVYIRQGVREKDKLHAKDWTRIMLDEVLSVGGTYYLPYQINATKEQFQKAYPNYKQFFLTKNKVDPSGRFSNKLWEEYLK